IEDSRLGERVLSRIHIEDWKGKLKQSFDNFDLVFEGGESHADGMYRAASILKEVLKSDDQNIVLVSHGNLTTLLLRYFNESFGFEHLMGMTNPDVFEVAVTGEQCVIHRIWDDRV
ncbi:MAG: histidine phosphatase family protein, partial [Bacillota bacterium]|nr:histidine phosphatase family protein [Bacillota bacterium]